MYGGGCRGNPLVHGFYQFSYLLDRIKGRAGERACSTAGFATLVSCDSWDPKMIQMLFGQIYNIQKKGFGKREKGLSSIKAEGGGCA